MDCEQYKTLVKNVLSGIVLTIQNLGQDPEFNHIVNIFLIDYLNDCINLISKDMFDQLSAMRNKGKTQINYLSSFGGTDTYLRGLCTSLAKQIRAITTNAADSLANKKKQGRCHGWNPHTTLSDRDLGSAVPECGFIPTQRMKELLPEFNQPKECTSDMFKRCSADRLAFDEAHKNEPELMRPWKWVDFEAKSPSAPIEQPKKIYAPLKASLFCSTPTDTVLNQNHTTCIGTCLAPRTGSREMRIR